MNEEEGPKDKKPPVKNRPLESLSLINLNHSSIIWEKSGNENDISEEIKRERTQRTQKKLPTLKSVAKTVESGPNYEKLKNPRIIMKYQEIKKIIEKPHVTKEMTLSNLGTNVFIGDSAATSHMMSNKMGVYNLTHKRACDDWKWAKHNLHTQWKIGDVCFVDRVVGGVGIHDMLKGGVTKGEGFTGLSVVQIIVYRRICREWLTSGSVIGLLIGMKVGVTGTDSPFWWRCGSCSGIMFLELLDGHITQKFLNVSRR